MSTQVATKILDELEGLSREEVSVDKATAMYLLMLRLLGHFGILSPQRRLFIPAIGADLFPTLYVHESWVSDKRLGIDEMRDAFKRLLVSTLSENTKGCMPTPRRHRKIHHSSEDFATSCENASWGRSMAAGDVLFLKHAREYILGQLKPATPHDWLHKVIVRVPKRAITVIFEPEAVTDRRLPLSLSEYLLDSGQFKDITPNLVGTDHYLRLQDINRRVLAFDRTKTRKRIPCYGCGLVACCYCKQGRRVPEVYFESIGALTVLEKR